MSAPPSASSLPDPGDAAGRREYALRRVDEQVTWYERHSGRQWLAFAVFQTAAVLLGSLTPVLILWSEVPKALQALPAALAAVAAGIVGIFHFPENKARYSFTAEALKSERVRYATRTGPYGRGHSDEQALDRFVSRTEELAMQEVADWRSELAGGSAAGAAAPSPSPETTRR